MRLGRPLVRVLVTFRRVAFSVPKCLRSQDDGGATPLLSNNNKAHGSNNKLICVHCCDAIKFGLKFQTMHGDGN